MSTQPQSGKAPGQALATGVPQSEFERLLLKDSKSKVEFKPFGSETAITLSIQIIRNYIAVPYKQGTTMVEPDDRECMKFLMLCRSRALNPFEGDAFMIPFWDKHLGRPVWSLITSHQAFLKRGEVHPEYDGKRSGVIINPQRCKPCAGEGVRGEHVCSACYGRGWYDELEGDYVPEEIDGEAVELRGGWCRVYFKERKNPEYQRLKLTTYDKGFGNWSFDAAGMICKCAEAAAMRTAFPTTLGGLYLREEMFNEDAGAKFKAPEFGAGKASAAPAGLGAENRKPQLFQPPAPEPEKPEAVLPDERNAAPEPEPEKVPPTAPPPQEAPQPPAAADKPKQTILVSVRNLCKIGKVPEGRLLELLADIGLTDGSQASLEDVLLTAPGILEKVYADWKSILKRLAPEAK